MSTLSRRDTLRLFGVAAAAMPLRLTWKGQAEGVDPIDVAPGLAILPRQAWAGSLAPLGQMAVEDVKFLLVHHTASPNNYSMSGAVDVIRSAYRLHTGPEKGWPDVCYNFFVDRFGRVWEGRAGSLDGPVVADATGGSQGFAQLVCLLGDFTSVMPSAEALDSLTRTLSWLADRFGLETAPNTTVDFVSRGSNRWPRGATITAAIISGHRDMSSTACPGDTFYPFVHSQLQGDVDALRQGAPAAAPTSTMITIAPTTIAPTTIAPTTIAPTTIAPTTVSSVDAPTTAALATTSTPATSVASTSTVTTSRAPAIVGSDAPVPTTGQAASPGTTNDNKWALPMVGLGGAALAVGAGVHLSRRRRSAPHTTEGAQP